MLSVDLVTKIRCAKCTIDTNHYSLHKLRCEINQEAEEFKIYETLKCSQCENVVFRIEKYKFKNKTFTSRGDPEKIGELFFPNNMLITEQKWYDW